MKYSTRAAWGGVVGALLAGCGEAPAPSDTENVFEPLTETLDRARGIEATVLEQAEEQRRQIEEAENGRR